ncbi:uncharacterized protein BXZ73DRAFT_106749 [Epithele typhae]|uniref:uncharacterized protein n=1 Tax=Epithele typhae TaxID=378194 RepID=UPI002007B1EE|nr:uncharacterized protein BXZ73DRAFT_106749 [Epithele typhae]KAH9913963.1 hypothetical protein BXZ73DRAFT_106749 [Epithele typhae]
MDSTINQLPQDIILEICKHAVALPTSSAPSGHSFESVATLRQLFGNTQLHTAYGDSDSAVETAQKEYISTLFTLSQVCQSWRETTLMMPSLWSRLQGALQHESDHLFRCMLQRSGTASLTISIEDIESPCFETMQDPDLQSRLVNFRFSMSETGREAILPERQWGRLLLVFPLSAPRLETLVLFAPKCFDSAGIFDELIVSAKSDPLFGADTGSQLRALALWPGVLMASSYGPFPRITHLYLSFYRCYEDVSITAILLRFLASCPNIEYTFVENALFDEIIDGNEFGQATRRPISIPSLRTLTFIGCEWMFSYHVVNNLALPNDAHVHIYCPDKGSASYDDLATPHLPFFNGPLRMSILLNFPFGFSLVFSGPPDPDPNQARSVRPNGRFQTTNFNDIYLHMHKPDGLRMRDMPLANVRALDVSFALTARDDEYLPALFERLPRLETFVVRFDSVKYRLYDKTPDDLARVVGALGTVLDALPWGDGPASCPCLRTLEVYLERVPVDVVDSIKARWTELLAERVDARGDRETPIEVLAEIRVEGRETVARWRYAELGALNTSTPRSCLEWMDAVDDPLVAATSQRKTPDESWVLEDLEQATAYWEVPWPVESLWKTRPDS